MKSHPRAVVEHRELVLLCLSDDDVTIRTRALELLTGMVTRKNLEELVVKLLARVGDAEGTYRDELVSRIVDMCSRDKYGYLSDFVWYLGVLVKLARLRGARHGALLAEQLVDIAMRVKPVRAYAARDMVCLLLDERLEVGQGLESVADVLAAAAWIAGEYAGALLDADDDDDDDDDENDPDALPKFPRDQPHRTLVDLLTHARVTRLPARVQNVYLQNALKVVALLAGPSGDAEELEATLGLVATRLDVFLQSVHVEVQERAAAFRALLLTFGALVPTARTVEVPTARTARRDDSDSDDDDDARPAPPKLRTVVEDAADAAAARRAAAALGAVAAEKMVPVNPKAQARVPVPGGLALDTPFLAGTALGDFLEAAPPAEDERRAVAFVEADEEFDDEPRGNDPFAETGAGGSGAFYDIQGSASDSDDGDEKKKKKKKKKEKRSKKDHRGGGGSNRAADADDPFYLAGSVRPADVDVDDVPVVRLTSESPRGGAPSRDARAFLREGLTLEKTPATARTRREGPPRSARRLSRGAIVSSRPPKRARRSSRAGPRT